MARRYALVVGISQYKSPLKSLSKTVTDAEAVANVLRSQGGFQDVTLLTGEVNSTSLIEALRRLLLEQAKGNDALIYFTGHGIPVIDPLMGEPKGYLATSDCVVRLQGTQVVEQQRGIAIASLNQLIQKSELSSLVVLLDCCHSGDFLERQLVEQSFTAFRGRQDYYLITACRGFEQAYAKKREQHSIFTGALLEGLSKSQADEEGNVTGDSLSAFIKRELRGSGQEPISMGFGGTITLVSYGTQINATKIDETCPYQGLEPFTEATQQFFFGRRNVVEQLRQKIESASFVALIGASGSGKSSVVRAGLIPQVREAGWRVLEPIKPGFDPLSELKRVFANQFHRRDEIQQVYEAIASGSLDPIVDLLPGTERILLLVDQFEEVFTVCADEEARRSLIHLITQVQSTRLAVIITMRADFLEPCLNYANLTQQLQQHQVLIPPLEGKALEEAIAKPAQNQGYTVEPALLSVIQRDVAQEKNCLPLLQFALQSLWDSATQAGHQLKLEQYEQLNGIAGALNQHGDRIYDLQDWQEASPTRPRSPQEQEWIKRLCLKLVRTGEGTRDTRQRQPKADLLALAGEDAENQAMVETVLKDLVDGRLLVTDQETENPTEESGSIAYVDLAHEALMEGWQRFADWRKDDRELRRLCDRIKDARLEWLTHRQNQDFLLSKGLLNEATKSWTKIKPYLSQGEQDFYLESFNHDKEKHSYESDIDEFKQHLQNLQKKLLEKSRGIKALSFETDVVEPSQEPLEDLNEEGSLRDEDSTESQESDLLELQAETSKMLDRLQIFEARSRNCNLAADWLSLHHEEFMEAIIQHICLSLSQASSTYQFNLSPEELQNLYKEINHYINWLRNSLQRGEPIDESIETSLSLSKRNYADSFEFISREWLSNALPENLFAELQLYLNHLITYFRCFD